MTRRRPTEKAPSSYRRYEQDADHPSAEEAHGRTYDGERLTAGPGGTTYKWDA